MEKDLTRGNPLGLILRFAIPMFIGNCFQQLYNMVDTVIVGRFVGDRALAAVGSVGTIFFLVVGASNGMAIGFTILTSQRFGAEDPVGTRRSVANGMLLSACTALVMSLLSLSLMRHLLTAMHTPSEIYEDAYAYISVICAGLVCTLFYNLMASFLRAVGSSRIPLYFLIFSSCLNVVLDLTFILCFHQGTRGAALATVLSQGVSALLCIVYICRKVPVLRPEASMFLPDMAVCREQLRSGLPMALIYVITASGTIIMQSAVNLFGAGAVAGYTAASKIHMFLTQGYFSMGQAMSAYAGQNYGSGDLARIRKGTRAACLILLVYTALSFTLSNTLLPVLLPFFFDPGTDISQFLVWAGTYIRINTAFYLFLGAIFVFRSVIQGVGRAETALAVGFAELAGRILMARASMRAGSYRMAVAADGAAWLCGALTALLLYFLVIRKLEREEGRTG
ncbi:MAG: MATE family efflux transporter [bacterium]